MTTLRTTIRTYLENDATLSALLPGGVFDDSELPRDGGGVDYAPRQGTGVRIRSFAVIAWQQSTPFDSSYVRAERQTLEVYLYQDSAYNIIESAADRIKSLLHNYETISDDRALVTVQYAYQSGKRYAEELNQSPMIFQRYEVSYVR